MRGKIARISRRVNHPSRIIHPLRRVGPEGAGQFERISRETALAEIADRFKAVVARRGVEAIFPCHHDGSNGLLSHDLLDACFFARLGASRLKRTLCSAPATAVVTGMYGRLPAVTVLEQHEIKRSYGSHVLGGVQPAFEPMGEARPNEWVFAQRADLDRPLPPARQRRRRWSLLQRHAGRGGEEPGWGRLKEPAGKAEENASHDAEARGSARAANRTVPIPPRDLREHPGGWNAPRAFHRGGPYGGEGARRERSCERLCAWSFRDLVNFAVCLDEEVGSTVVKVSGGRVAYAAAAIRQGWRRFWKQAEKRPEMRRFVSHLRRALFPRRQARVDLPACARTGTCTGQGTTGPSRSQPCPRTASTVDCPRWTPLPSPRGSAVDVSSMSNRDDDDHQPGVHNLVHDSIVPLADPVVLLAGQLHATQRPRVVAERLDPVHDSLEVALRDGLDIPGDRAFELEAISAHGP